MVPPTLAEALVAARAESRKMSPTDLDVQARNFAAGNIGLEDPLVTRELVDRAVLRSRQRR